MSTNFVPTTFNKYIIFQILEGRINDKVAMKFVEIRKKAMEAEDFKLENENSSGAQKATNPNSES